MTLRRQFLNFSNDGGGRVKNFVTSFMDDLQCKKGNMHIKSKIVKNTYFEVKIGFFICEFKIPGPK